MVFFHGGEATNSFLIAIESLQFNINFETLAQAVAVRFSVL